MRNAVRMEEGQLVRVLTDVYVSQGVFRGWYHDSIVVDVEDPITNKIQRQFIAFRHIQIIELLDSTECGDESE